jgi:hypothetical protein
MFRKALRGLLAKAKLLRQIDRAVGGHRSHDPLWETQRSGQWQGQTFTRWWTNKCTDLIVWYKKDRRSPVGFQLCYNKGTDEHALTWTVKEGYRHNRIDDGETRSIAAGYKMAAVLVPDGSFDPKRIAERFLLDLGDVDQNTAAFVYARLMEYLP